MKDNASFSQRGGAHIFDFLIIFIPVLGVTKLFTLPDDLLVGLVWLSLFCYDTLMISKYKGQTIGKKLSHIQVVMESGKEITVWNALRRSAIKWLISGLIFGLGFLMMLNSEKSQALHDRIVGTLVKKTV